MSKKLTEYEKLTRRLRKLRAQEDRAYKKWTEIHEKWAYVSFKRDELR